MYSHLFPCNSRSGHSQPDPGLSHDLGILNVLEYCPGHTGSYKSSIAIKNGLSIGWDHGFDTVYTGFELTHRDTLLYEAFPAMDPTKGQFSIHDGLHDLDIPEFH